MISLRASRHACVAALFVAGGVALVGARATDVGAVAPAFVGQDRFDELRSVDDLRELEATVVEQIQRLRPSVVALRLEGARGMQSTASAVVIGPDGLLATCGHVGRRPGRAVTAILADGTELSGRTLGQRLERGLDCGLVQLDTKGRSLPAVPIGSTLDLATGDWVIALGYTHGIPDDMRPPLARVGRVLDVRENELFFDAAIDAGDSGGPALNLRGELVGLNARCGRPSWQNVATRIDRLVERMEEMRAEVGAEPPAAEGGAVAGDGGEDPSIERGAPARPERSARPTPSTRPDQPANPDRTMRSRPPTRPQQSTRPEQSIGPQAPDRPSTETDREPVRAEPADARPDRTGYPDGDGPASRLAAARSLPLAAIVEPVASSMARVIVGDERVAYATVVDSAGVLVTKASQLPGDQPVTIEFDDGRRHAAREIGRDRASDLALLRIELADGESLRAVTWAGEIVVQPGEVLLTPRAGDDPPSLGFAAIERRESRRDLIDSPYLGVGTRSADHAELESIGAAQATIVQRVRPGSAAEAAGIEIGDAILAVDGRPVSGPDDLRRMLQQRSVGDAVELEVVHSGDRRSLRVVLGRRGDAEESMRRGNTATAVSRVSSGLGSLLAHDTITQPDEMGGPVLDLEGRVVGLNIARFDRTATHAIGADRVVEVVGRLRREADVARQPRSGVGEADVPVGVDRDR
ncbi:MAG: trypsin-like peptidase domain-containing protein [Phycisphaerales bacterium]